jgi:hypothetical protein
MLHHFLVTVAAAAAAALLTLPSIWLIYVNPENANYYIF